MAELMTKTRLNKVWLVGYPHILPISQSRLMSVFLALWTLYRQEMREWASYDTISRQKQLFLSVYETASEKAFTEKKTIRAGFHTAGIYLVDVDKALSAVFSKKRSKSLI
jgi:hypothetical protein